MVFGALVVLRRPATASTTLGVKHAVMKTPTVIDNAKRTHAAILGVATAGALLAGVAVGPVPRAEATCISVSGLTLGSGCASAPFSLAIGLGSGANAKAINPFGFVVGVGHGAQPSTPVRNVGDLFAGIGSAISDVIDRLSHPGGGLAARPKGGGKVTPAGTDGGSAAKPKDGATVTPAGTGGGSAVKPKGDGPKRGPNGFDSAYDAGQGAAEKINATKNADERKAAMAGAAKAATFFDAYHYAFFQGLDDNIDYPEGEKSLLSVDGDLEAIRDASREVKRLSALTRQFDQAFQAGSAAAKKINAAKDAAERRAALADAAKSLAALDDSNPYGFFVALDQEVDDPDGDGKWDNVLAEYEGIKKAAAEAKKPAVADTKSPKTTSEANADEPAEAPAVELARTASRPAKDGEPVDHTGDSESAATVAKSADEVVTSEELATKSPSKNAVSAREDATSDVTDTTTAKKPTVDSEKSGAAEKESDSTDESGASTSAKVSATDPDSVS